VNTCTASRADGQPCRASPAPGRTLCRWHDPAPEARQRHIAEARRGGHAKAYGSLVSGVPLADAVASFDLGTPDGLRQLLAAVLRGLASLPLDVRAANSFAQVAGVQRALIESSDLDARIRALEERAASPRLRRA